jgi:hypothetical protein
MPVPRSTLSHRTCTVGRVSAAVATRSGSLLLCQSHAHTNTHASSGRFGHLNIDRWAGRDASVPVAGPQHPADVGTLLQRYCIGKLRR